MSRSNLTNRAHALQRSLLASLGLVPLACGGSAVTTGIDPGAGGSAGFGGSPVTYGGDGPVAGLGGSAFGGSSSYGGSTTVPGGSGGGGNRACEQPTLDPITRLVKCANGFEHRPSGVTCVLPQPPLGEGGAPSEAGGAAGATSSCTTDSDCSNWRLGYCEHYDGLSTSPSCQSGCLQDEDCDPGTVCACNGSDHGGNCIAAGCETDAQCGPGSLCATANGACGEATFACQLPTDTCLSSADCSSGMCAVDRGYRSCFTGSCGRPFLVAEAQRLARVRASGEWLGESPCLPNLEGLSPPARAVLAAHWSRLAQMEHASIAAFARFSLQLLSLGAPSSLIEACTRAIADETAHTRSCFDMASHYGGAQLGPAPLDISGCLEVTGLVEIAKLVLVEGCLGETGAALEALEAAATATEPAVKMAFSRIASDEQRHAELAFQFLNWALGQAPVGARAELAREAEQRLQEPECAIDPRAREAESLQAELLAHGFLPALALHQVRQHALRDVVTPLLVSLGLVRFNDPAAARMRPPTLSLG